MPSPIVAVTIFVLNVVGQSMQNICLPLALSDGDHMCVVLVYMCFVYFVVFSLAEAILDWWMAPSVRAVNTSIQSKGAATASDSLLSHGSVVGGSGGGSGGSLDHPMGAPTTAPAAGSLTAVPLNGGETALVVVGFHNALNGVGSIFGGSSTRTPLTMQMSGSLLINLLAPFYKLWVYGLPFGKAARFGWSYAFAVALYGIAFALTLVDKLHNSDSAGTLSAFCILFWIGAIFGMTYNVHQDKLMLHIQFKDLSFGESLHMAVRILRKQLTWLFVFSWLAVLLALIPSFDQAGLTRAGFEQSWSDFLPFGNTAMNLFNLGYIICFVTGIAMNKYDSAFNMLTSNISAVLSLWTGWVASLEMQTVGFRPNVGLTVGAMVCSVVAIYPSWRYSIEMKRIMEQGNTSAATGSGSGSGSSDAALSSIHAGGGAADD